MTDEEVHEIINNSIYEKEIDEKIKIYPDINDKIANNEIYKLSLFDFKEMYKLVVTSFNTLSFRKESLYNHLVFKQYDYYGIRYDNKLVGLVSITDMFDKQGRINILAVAENYRNIGIGKQLLKYVLNKYEQESYECVWLETGLNNKAIKLYEKNGFERIGQVIDDYNVLNDELGISMVKQIKNR